jgi:hypothetical protein
MFFWKWLKLFSTEKMKERHIHKYGMDTKCRNCHTWASENGGYADVYEHSDGTTSLQCKRCYRASRWNLDAPVPIFLMGDTKPVEQKDVGKWQDTITAPRDGTRVAFCDVVNGGTPFIAFCADGDNDWRCDYDGSWIEWEPYQWAGLPPIPEALAAIKGEL